MSVRKTQIILLLTALLLAVITTLLLFQLRKEEKKKEVMMASGLEEKGLLSFTNQNVQEYKIAGTLKEAPFIGDGRFTFFKIEIKTNLDKKGELNIRAFLVTGPDGERSVPVTRVETFEKENLQDSIANTLYSEDEAVSFLKDYVGKEIIVTLVMSKDKKDMEGVLEEIASSDNCLELCGSMVGVVKENLSESIKAFNYWREKNQKLDGLTINSLVTNIYVQE